jgi:hypothetical protein
MEDFDRDDKLLLMLLTVKRAQDGKFVYRYEPIPDGEDIFQSEFCMSLVLPVELVSEWGTE